MKLENITHDHLLTKWLKVIIFAILMLAPIFSVAIRCAYVVCNKNAYKSYSDNAYVEKLASVSPTTSLIEGENYQLTLDLSKGNATMQSVLYNYSSISIDWTNYGAPSGYNYNGFSIYTIATRLDYYVYLSVDGNTVYTIWSGKDDIGYDWSFTLVPSQDIQQNGNQPFNIFTYVMGKQSLDNVFDYSVNELKNDQLFNWTQNTGIYTGVNAMTTGLGLTDGTIAILITYWTLLSIIYVIIDIVLEGFVALTHMILKKAS